MEEYYFLFALGLAWSLFAAVQDLRTKEVSNWLNLSLIAFALAYRAFYSAATKDIWFFLYGLGGVLLFIGLAYAFYYGRAFAGGDAKLLMGIGAVLPFESLGDYAFIGMGFVFALFFVGAIWSLLYTIFLVARNQQKFGRAFKLEIKKQKLSWYAAVIGAVIFAALIIYSKILFLLWFLALILVMPFLFSYVKAVEKACMLVVKNPEQLTEGDWLTDDVKIGKSTIKKTVHGLSALDIALLKKARKSVIIKDGIPFTIAFFIALLIMVFFFLAQKNLFAAVF